MSDGALGALPHPIRQQAQTPSADATTEWTGNAFRIPIHYRRVRPGDQLRNGYTVFLPRVLDLQRQTSLQKLLYDIRVGQCRDIAEVLCFIRRNFAQDSTHDFA
jgi:hypothetical protein